MIDAKKFRRSPDLTSWLRAPAAESFAKGLEANTAEALNGLLAACAASPDERVRHYYAEWKTLTDLTTFLRANRKESTGDDD